MSEQRVQTPDEAWPSADIVYAELRDRVNLQLAQVDALDGKANFVMGSASLLTAATGALRNAVKPTDGTSLGHWSVIGWDIDASAMVNVVTVLTFATFVVVAWCSFQAYRVRLFTITPDPIVGARILFNKYLGQLPGDTKVALTNRRMLDDLPENEAQIERKAVWLEWALKAFLVEAGLLLTIGVLTAFL